MRIHECYFCSRNLRHGHWPMCPVLEMTRYQARAFFNLADFARHFEYAKDGGEPIAVPPPDELPITGTPQYILDYQRAVNRHSHGGGL